MSKTKLRLFNYEGARWWHTLRWRFLQFTPWLSVVFLVMLITIPPSLFIWFLFFTDSFSVQAVTILDGREHTSMATRQIIEQGLATTPLHANIFFLQTDLMEQEISRQLPQIRTVHITRHLPGTVKAVIQEKIPALLLLSGGSYYFIDEQGQAYEKARLETLPGVILPTVKNTDLKSQVTIGAPAVAPSFVGFVRYVQENLSAVTEGTVAEIRIPSLAAREVHFLLSNNWEIRFDVTRSGAEQLDILRRVVTEIIPPDEKEKLDYIDLRIKDRVYYKSLDPVPAKNQQI